MSLLPTIGDTHYTSYANGWTLECGADKNEILFGRYQVSATENIKYVTCKKCVEFQIGDIVTLDRYNHIDDVETVEVTGYGVMPVSGTLTYKMSVKGTTIESTGKSIMESTKYEPAPAEDRHHKIGISYADQEKYWEEKKKKK